MFKSYVVTAYSNANFSAHHFILSDINKKFLKQHDLSKYSVKEFKEIVRKEKPEFRTPAGNFTRAYKMVNVYNINTIKENLKIKELENG